MVLLVVLAPILLPEHRDPARGKLDLLGVALSLAAILPVIYGVKELAVNGYSVLPVLGIAIGVVCGFGFVYRQRRTASPLIDLTLFHYRAFSGSVIVGLMVMAALMGMSVFTFQFVQLVLGMRPFTAALWSLAVMPLIGIAIGVTTPLSHRVRPGYLIAGGLVLMTAGFVVLTQVKVTSPLLFVLAGPACLAAGMVASKMLIADIVLTAAPPERAGSSVAISETASEFGAALGFATLGSVGSAVFHHQMANVKPAGLPPEALRAAQDTLGGTAAVAQRLPQPAGSALFNAGREAFTHGLNATALTGAVVMIAVAVLVAFLLRKVPVSSSPEKKDALEQTALVGS
jgi:DHA2 family multidrug resistance protein-like MFS transporter